MISKRGSNTIGVDAIYSMISVLPLGRGRAISISDAEFQPAHAMMTHARFIHPDRGLALNRAQRVNPKVESAITTPYPRGTV